MSTVRLSYTNYMPKALLKNGTGGGAPARDEIAGYPMENALNVDRYTPYIVDFGSDFKYDVDLGANHIVGLIALLNMGILFPGDVGLYNVSLVEYSTSVNGYPPTAPSSWTSVPGDWPLSIPLGQRDIGLVFTSGGVPVTVNARYFRIHLDSAGAASLGRFHLGKFDWDPGFLYNPGAENERLYRTTRLIMGSGAPVVTRVGRDSRRFTLPLNAITDAQRATLNAVADQPNPFAYFDPQDEVHEVRLYQDSFQSNHIWAAPGLWNATMALEKLP